MYISIRHITRPKIVLDGDDVCNLGAARLYSIDVRADETVTGSIDDIPFLVQADSERLTGYLPDPNPDLTAAERAEAPLLRFVDPLDYISDDDPDKPAAIVIYGLSIESVPSCDNLSPIPGRSEGAYGGGYERQLTLAGVQIGDFGLNNGWLSPDTTLSNTEIALDSDTHLFGMLDAIPPSAKIIDWRRLGSVGE